MQRFNKFIAVFLLAVLSLFIVPKELLHDLHHHDTVDQVNHEAGDQIEKAHHHCIALELSAPPFLHSFSFFKIFLSAVQTSFQVLSVSASYSALHYNSPLRGPPCIVL